ncbi:MAG: hypothetical protein EP307_00030 [Rhodobacteraceae bacterium]|nr:MAG: hypothetical protein EP307_00030 [Paracoccaceae bacterium]
MRLINSEFGTGGCANPWKDRRMSPMPRSLSRASRRVTAAMARLDLATCEAALPPGDAPEWVHLLPPKGRITARDGRQSVARESCGFACRKSCGFAVDDPARLVVDFEGRAVDLPVDFAHQTELADSKSGGPAPRGRLDQGTSPRRNRPLCLGGMDRPRRRDDRGAGIPHPFARVASHDDAGVITQAKSAGLVHNPALQRDPLPVEARRHEAPCRPDGPRQARPQGCRETGPCQRARAASPGPAR